jgi:hypothetical protein
MKKMTPREALYYVCLELGPVANTQRDDNITPDEVRLRDAVRTLQNFVRYHDDADKYLPASVDEFVRIQPRPAGNSVLIPPTPRASNRGDGKERLDTWKEEIKNKIEVGRTKY